MFLGALKPEEGSFKPVGPTNPGEVQGSTTEVKDVELLQKGVPDGPPSP